MSAAATAAGYLYASGRLRGRSGKEEDQGQHHKETERAAPKAPPREKIRVAVVPEKDEKPRRTPKIEYRTRRRWSPE